MSTIDNSKENLPYTLKINDYQSIYKSFKVEYCNSQIKNLNTYHSLDD
jgi:hypothetical protein